MKEEKFNNLIHKIKENKMTSLEKSITKHNVMSFVHNNPIAVKKVSPKVKSPYYSSFSFGHISKLVGVAMLIVVLGIGGISGASASALPGDALYPVKTNIKEKIEEAISFTPEAKIAYRKRIIETRLQETEDLLNLNKLTPQTQIELNTNIENQTKEIKNNLAEIKKVRPDVAKFQEQELNQDIVIHRTRIDKLLEKIQNKDTKIEKNTLKTNNNIETKVQEIKNIKIDNHVIKQNLNTNIDYSSNTSKSLPKDLAPEEKLLLRKNQTDKTAKEIKIDQKIIPVKL